MMDTMWEYNPISRFQPTEITPRIRNILIQYAFPKQGLTIQEYIQSGKEKFFNFDFPWYSEDKSGLEEFKTLFLSKYWLYQIGQETEELFKLQLQVRLMENMPYWKQLFDSAKLLYDPLTNRVMQKDVRTTDRGRGQVVGSQNKNGADNTTVNNTRTSDSNSTQNTQSVGSDNPQVTVNTQDYASSMNRGKMEDVLRGTETDSGTNVSTTNLSSDNREESTSENSKEEIYAEHGFVGDSQTDNIIKYREAIININLEIAEYLKPCFLFVIN